MSRKQIQTLCRILAGSALLLAAVLIPARGILRLLLFLVPYLLAGGDVLWRALRNILRGQVFDENFLMAVATIGAFCIGEYPEAVLVMVFYQGCEWFQGYAVGRSRSSIAALMDIRPDHSQPRNAGWLQPGGSRGDRGGRCHRGQIGGTYPFGRHSPGGQEHGGHRRSDRRIPAP